MRAALAIARRLRAVVLATTLLVTPAPDVVAAPAELYGTVVYVVDGDTIHVQVSDRLEKVRYIGINAPEVPHPHADATERHRLRFLPQTIAAGEAARRVNAELVAGKRVRLTLDRQHRDRYDRLLAYVWVGDTMINAEMLRRGYAEAMSIPPDFRHRALFVRLHAEARAVGRGLWADARNSGAR
jgi:micrococcal nuclease